MHSRAVCLALIVVPLLAVLALAGAPVAAAILALAALAVAVHAWFDRRGVALLLVLVVASCAGNPAFAADGVIVPAGDWISSALGLIGSLLLALAMWGLRQLPAALFNFLQAARVDQLLTAAIDYGLVAAREATAGATISFTTRSAVLDAALSYAVRQAPVLVRWAGGEALVRDKLLVRLARKVEAEPALSPTAPAA